MAQAITPALAALLKSKNLAGPRGFRGEIEIDWVPPQDSASIVQQVTIVNNGAGNGHTTLPAAVTAGNLLVVGITKDGTMSVAGPNVYSWLGAGDRPFTEFAGSPQAMRGDDTALLAWRIATGDERDLGWRIAFSEITLWEVITDADPTTLEVVANTGTGTVKALPAFSSPGTLQLMVYAVSTLSGGVDLNEVVAAGWTQDSQTGRPDPFGHYFDPTHIAAHASSGPTPSLTGPSRLWAGIAVGISSATVPTQSITLRVQSLNVDRSRKMAAAQLDVQLPNEDGAHGWYRQESPIVAPNNPVRAYAWWGDYANRVCIFTGLLDRVHETRDPKRLTLKARSRMKWLFEQGFEATASQQTGDTGAVRTEANGVYLNRAIEYTVADILDRAGWPTADRDIATTGVTLSEYDLADLGSWASQIVGTNRLGTAATCDLWEDELGVIHFAPNLLTASGALTPDYSLAAGVDVLQLDHETDDEALATRVRISGPMTSTVPKWSQTWATTLLTHPVGSAYRGTEPGYLYVIDRVTQNLYKLRQSDRVIVAHWYLGGSLTNQPIGLSGDPTDSAHFYVLDAHLPGSGTYTNCKVRKYAFAAPTTLISTTSLPNGEWSDMKFDGSHLWLTNYGDDKLYEKTFVAGGAAGATGSWSYAGHTNPTGLYLSGTTIGLFFNGGAAFYLIATGAPGVITGTQSTSGTHILGGEIDSTTGIDLYATNEAGDFGAAAGHVWKFALAEQITTDVTALASDQALEDALGSQSGIGNRVHDLHSGDAAHPWEKRLVTLSMEVVQSVAQAQAVADAQLVLLSALRRVMDLAAIGNPALQINDVIRYTDPIANIDAVWLLDSYKAALAADGTYLTSLSALPIPDGTPA